jgi:nitrilase
MPYTKPLPFRIAAAQLSPVLLDRDATIARACDAMAEAARGGARLVVFPECFVPGYPLWVWTVPAGQSLPLRALYAELLDQAVTLDGDAVARLCEAARAADVHVAIGVNERNVEASGTSLYNTLLFIGADGRVLGAHRKLVPTAGERLVHAMGDGRDLAVHRTPLGMLSGLVCWENYMPLARHTLYRRGVQLWVAPTWDRGEPWLSTMRHVAKEGRVYVVGCCGAMRLDDVPDRLAFKAQLGAPNGWVNPGDSLVVDPDGKIVAGPLHEAQALLFADVEPERITGPRWQLDVAGHYDRPDVFRFAPPPLAVERSDVPAETAQPPVAVDALGTPAERVGR